MIIGAMVVFGDSAIQSDACGQTYHIWKVVLGNIVFTTFSLASFCLLPGGGEAARARAMTCAVFHAAFTVWLLLLNMHMSEQCVEVISSKFKMLNLFMYVCFGHNLSLSLFYSLHEAWLGPLFATDFTIIAEIRIKKGAYTALHGGAMGSPKSPLPNNAPLHPPDNLPLNPAWENPNLQSPVPIQQMQSVQSVDQQINAQAAPAGPYLGSMHTSQP